MGIIRIVIEAGLVTTGMAALRRSTGIGVKDMLLARVQNQYATKFITAYFNAGESLCEKCISQYNSVFKSDSSKPDTSTTKKD